MKHWIIVLGCFLMLATSASATVESFTMTTDANGYAKDSDSVPFGSYKINNFSVSHACGTISIVLDGATVFKASVAANQKYSVNATAKKTVDLIVTGAMAKAKITFTVDYTFSSFSSREAESFAIKTDAGGNATEEDSVPFGKYTVNSFTSTHAFAKMQIVLDGTAVFSQAVAANTTYPISASARKTVKMIMQGGPKSTNVTFSVNYSFAPTVAEDARYTTERESDTLQMGTDGNGNSSAKDSVPFGKYTCKSFKSTHSCKLLKVVLDGKAVFQQAINAGTSYTVNASAGKTVELIVNGAPANTNITFTIEYAFSPFRDASDLDREVITFITDNNGSAGEKKTIPFGKLTVKNFSADENFDQATIILDDKVVFQNAIVAGQSYSINAVARKKVEVKVSGGSANKTIEVTVDYSYSPFRLQFADATQYKIFKIKAMSSIYGDVSIPETIVCSDKTMIHGFSSTMAFTKATVILDDKTVFPPSCGCEAVEANKLYKLDLPLEPGKHVFSAFATGEQPETEVVFTIYYE